MADQRPAWMTDDNLWQNALNAVPLPIFVVDDDMRIMAFNPAATALLGETSDTVFRRRGGEALHCLHHTDAPGGCGQGPSCSNCVLRNSVNLAMQGQRVSQKRTTMELARGDSVRKVELLVTASSFAHDGQRLALLVLEDVTELATLRQLLPICASCKKVRDDQDYWQTVEKFFTANLNVDFSHGICPDCAKKLYPDLYDEIQELRRSASVATGDSK